MSPESLRQSPPQRITSSISASLKSCRKSRTQAETSTSPQDATANHFENRQSSVAIHPSHPKSRERIKSADRFSLRHAASQIQGRGRLSLISVERLSDYFEGRLDTAPLLCASYALGVFPRFVEVHGPTYLNVHGSLQQALEFGAPVRRIRNMAAMRRPILVRFQWKSNNEFETRDLQNAFRAKHGNHLKQMQVDLPIRLIFTRPIRLEGYDFQRQAFEIGARDENGFGDDLLGFQESRGRFEIRPASFYSVSRTDLLVVHSAPTVIRGLMRVPPDVARTLAPSRNPKDRTVYAAAVVTLHKASLACSAAANHRHVTARLDALAVFSDERLTKRVANLDFAQFVPSVLETGVDCAFAKNRNSVAADQLAVVALVAQQFPKLLGETQWERIWRYVMDRDIERYGQGSRVIDDARKNGPAASRHKPPELLNLVAALSLNAVARGIGAVQTGNRSGLIA